MPVGSADSRVSAGLLVLRVGLGLFFMMVHGGPKLLAGPGQWETVGAAMGRLGITAFPAFWGLCAAASEFFGGLCLLLGLWTRPACAFMLATMAVAATMHLTQGDGLGVASHALEDGIAFLALLIAGPGAHSLDRAMFSRGPEGGRYSLP